MTRKKFLQKLEELLQIDYPLSEDMLLENIEEYDSLALLSLSVLYDQEFNIFIKGEELKACKNIGDLVTLIPAEKLKS
ncbi:acyl carrier protein [Campylobacter lari]|uniref:acyl carrier protein n=1 Tax=Campylobacter lari TaxID=201 RepID=UPI0012C78CD4|nr:acyl carrier protein [Campylobacter lari]EAK0442725.1 acyl carrier protein [Campylobacter lari]EGK8095008.1 acyl carrier protein [Campylobacter lari]EHH0538387.1 acyl carrier protein [Campylobacter lari]MCW0188513.1 acyl carrier protein [Campylobacter lari]MCW0243572.1 acyl carrier protein [Campylobacter lari]